MGDARDQLEALLERLLKPPRDREEVKAEIETEARAEAEKPAPEGLLLDFASGTERFADRSARRREQREVEVAERERREQEQLEREATQARERWLSDLATWPRAFPERLRRRVERACATHSVRNDHGGWDEEEWGGAALYAARRKGERGGRYVCSFEEDALDQIKRLMWAAAHRRDPDALRRRSRSSERAPRERLEFRKAELLHALWSWGHRRVDRAALRAHLLTRRAEDVARERALLTQARETLARVTVDLARGTCRTGARAGQPLTARARLATETRASRARAAVAEYEQKLAMWAAEPDPLRAWVRA
jgi:hypothetical protein